MTDAGRRTRGRVAGVALATTLGLASAAGYFFVARHGPKLPSAAGTATALGANVLIITVDTLRADHLAPYGYARLETPTISRLAHEGVLFKAAYTPVPLTLPSHCTMFTGLLPSTHGVRDNGGYYLEGSRQTLATLLKANGYNTAAFVSAFVLDSHWGLATGFDYYYDHFPVSMNDLAAMARIQRPAGDTWAQARRWLDAHASERFFVWMHLFDPHTPYTPPEPFRTQFADRPYDGEIAYVDAILSDVVADLKRRSLLERTLIVFLSDHGEGLGDHDEDEHGLLTYDSTLHVPWIVRLPNRQRADTVVEQPVSLVDVLPTVLDLVGVPSPRDIDGTSRARLVQSSNADRGDVLYAESFYPRLRFGWSELVSVRRDRFKLIRGRRPELYDYRNDPKETTNLAARRPDVVASLDQILSRMVAARSKQPPRTTAADPEAGRRLQALGYFSGSTLIAATPSSLADPRDKAGVYRALMRGRRLLAEGPESEGVLVLQTLLAQEPDFEPAHRTLREYWLGRSRFAEADRWLRGQLARRSGDLRLLVDLAVIYRAAKQPDRALAALSEAVDGHPDDTEALTLSGEILRDLHRYDAALDRFARAEKLVPGDTTVKMQIATTLLAMGRLADSESSLSEVLAADPHTAGAHYLLAQIADQRRDALRAASEYRKEIAQSPWDYRARFNLARLLARHGDHREELELLEPIPKLAPDFYEVYFYLAKALLDAGDSGRFQDAIAAAQLGLKMAPASSSAPLGHYTLSDIYRLQGRQADSQRELSLGQELERRLGEPPR